MIQYDPALPWSAPAAGRPQPGLDLLMKYLLATYGGTNLGIFADRAMRGGSRPSLHRDGRALDWRNESLSIRDLACEFLIANADLLQVQAIHFYERSQIWKPGEGWHTATGTSFGDPSAKWLHVELNLKGSANTVPVVDLLPPKPTPKESEMEYWKASNNLYLIGAGDPIPVTGAEKADYDEQRKAKGEPPLRTYNVPDRWVKIAGPNG